MPVPAVAIAGGALILWALSKKSGAQNTCPPGLVPDGAGRCVTPTGGGAGGASGPDAGKIASGVVGSVLSVGGTVAGAVLKTATVGGGTATAAGTSTTEATAIATTSVVTAADVGFGILGGVFLLLMVGMIIAPSIIDIIQTNRAAWERAREVNGGRRYFNAILHQEMKQFETVIENTVNELNAKGAPYVSFNPGQALKPGATSIPYSFTRDAFDRDAYESVDLPYDGDVYYYVNSIDPRLPLLQLGDAHVVARFAGWAAAEEQNRCIWNFYGTSPMGVILPGTPQAAINGPGGLTPAGRAIFSMEPDSLRPALETLFSGVALKFTAGIPMPTSYEGLYSATSNALARAAQVGQSVPSVAQLEYKSRVIGTFRGVAQASNVGISQIFPGAAIYAQEIWSRCGLAAAGWPVPRQLNIPGSPGAGGDPAGWTWFIVDPSGQYAIDVGTSGVLGSPKVYAVPQVAPAVPVGTRTRFGRARFGDAAADQQAVQDEYTRQLRASQAANMAIAKAQSSDSQFLRGSGGSVLPLALAAGAAVWFFTRKKGA